MPKPPEPVQPGTPPADTAPMPSALPNLLAAASRAEHRTRWYTYALIVLGCAIFLFINGWYVVATRRGERQQTEILAISREERTRMDVFLRQNAEERAAAAAVIETRQRQIAERQLLLLKKIDLLLEHAGVKGGN